MLGRLGARALEPLELLVDRGAHAVGRVELGEAGAVLADDVVVALAELLADRGELLAKEELALLLVDTLADVVADRLGDLQLGQVTAGPRHDQLDSRRNVDRAQHGEPGDVVELGPQRDRVGERPWVEVAPQQFGQATRTSQVSDQLEDGAQLPGDVLERGRRPWIAQHFVFGDVGATLVTVDRDHSRPRLDLNDRDRLARRQRTHVGDPGEHRQLVLLAAGEQQRTTRGGLDGAAELLGCERDGQHGARQDHTRQVGDGEAGTDTRSRHVSKGSDTKLD